MGSFQYSCHGRPFKLSTILPTDVTHVINLTGISRLSACTGPGNKAEEMYMWNGYVVKLYGDINNPRGP